MKTIILTAAVLLLTLSVKAQNIENIFSISEKSTSKMAIYDVPEIDRVVEVEGKTALELYEVVKLAVATQWKNPDEVIDGSSEGKYLKFSGAGSVIFIGRGGLFAYYAETRVRYMFKFKDGKFMYTVKYEFYVRPSEYNTGGWVPMAVASKVNNKKSTQNINDSMKTLTDEVNAFINLILSEKSNPDSQDW